MLPYLGKEQQCMFIFISFLLIAALAATNSSSATTASSNKDIKYLVKSIQKISQVG